MNTIDTTARTINTNGSVPPHCGNHRETLIPLAAIALCFTFAGSSVTRAGTRTIANNTGAPTPSLVEALVEPFPKIEVTGAGATLSRDPDGGFRLSAINGPDLVKLSGKASRIVVDSINGEPVVDLSGLVTPQIEFAGAINGSPRIAVACDGGSVEFHQSINGSPRITITCPGGSVKFIKAVAGSTELTLKVPHGRVAFHSPVQGGTKLEIIGSEVNFSAGLEGGATADLTLTPDGILNYGVLNGGSALTFRKNAADDPALAVHGDPSGSGHLIEAPPAAAKPE